MVTRVEAWADQGTPPGQTVAGRVGIVTVMDSPSAAQRPYAFVLSDRHLWVNWLNGTQWIWGDQGTPPGQTVAGRVGIVTVMDSPSAAQRPYVFVIGGDDGHLWLNWWNGSEWAWADQGIPPGQTVIGGVGIVTVMDSPSAAQRPFAFVIGSDHHLLVNWWNGSQWIWGDQGTPPDQTVAGGVGIVTVMDSPAGRQQFCPYVFVIGSAITATYG